MWDENGDRSVPAQCGGGKMRPLVGYAITVSNLVLIRSDLTKELSGCKSMLEKLSVKRLCGIKKGAVSDLIAPDVAAGSLKTICLKELSNGQVHLERLQVSDRGLGAALNCLGLEILHLVKTPECTNVGLVVIADRCKHLRKLILMGRRGIGLGMKD
ncbi:hypothetical protein IFM89_031501 [Coptis chinensis]|uniref:Uncharacterized protein n=1 Tax=Coptis chinensis TaxID=261450 RepID=A0A835HIN5_9MAGN|nr:hypothetical protein IFM89_031501 [Coptis chinensis]